MHLPIILNSLIPAIYRRLPVGSDIELYTGLYLAEQVQGAVQTVRTGTCVDHADIRVVGLVRSSAAPSTINAVGLDTQRITCWKVCNASYVVWVIAVVVPLQRGHGACFVFASLA